MAAMLLLSIAEIERLQADLDAMKQALAGVKSMHADELEEIERLKTLFGSRFHLDSACGSCGGPLDVERDDICCRCTDADVAGEVERLQAIVDEVRSSGI